MRRLWILPSVAFGLASLLFAGLGGWQLARAEQKRELQTLHARRMAEPPVDLGTAFPERGIADQMRWRRVRASGRYDASHQLLLDNQVLSNRVGYSVLTPFRLAAEDGWVLVNRGWIPAGASRAIIPDLGVADERITLQGIIALPYRPPILLSERIAESLSPALLRVQALDIAQLQEQWRRKLLPYVVQLDRDEPFGYIRKWSAPGGDRQRHIAYAVQWFLLAGAASVLSVRLGLRRERDSRPSPSP